MDEGWSRSHQAAEGIEDTGSDAPLVDEPVARGHRHAEGLPYHPDELPDERVYLSDRDLEYIAGLVEREAAASYGIPVDGLEMELVEGPDNSGYDPDAGTVALWSSDGEGRPGYLVGNAAMHIADAYDDALEEAVERRLAVIEDRYQEADDVEVSARFWDIKDAGQYTHDREEICIDRGRASEIYPGSGSVEYSLRRLIDHEVAHAVHQQTSPAVEQLSDAVAAGTAGHAEYRDHVGRAAIEAIATFEEDPGGEEPGSDNALPYRFLERGLGHTYELISSRADPASADEGLVFDDPYDLGRVTAVVVDAAYRAQHGEEQGRELARQTLMTATTPAGMEGMLGSGLEMLGMPDIPEILRQEYEQLRERGPERYVEERTAELAAAAEDPADEELDRLFIETEAVREVAGDLPYALPGSFRDTFSRVRELRGETDDTG